MICGFTTRYNFGGMFSSSSSPYSTTITRKGTFTWGAASPTPGAARIVSTKSSMIVCRSFPKSVTLRALRRKVGWGRVMISRAAIPTSIYPIFFVHIRIFFFLASFLCVSMIDRHYIHKALPLARHLGQLLPPAQGIHTIKNILLGTGRIVNAHEIELGFTHINDHL